MLKGRLFDYVFVLSLQYLNIFNKMFFLFLCEKYYICKVRKTEIVRLRITST